MCTLHPIVLLNKQRYKIHFYEKIMHLNKNLFHILNMIYIYISKLGVIIQLLKLCSKYRRDKKYSILYHN